MMSFRNQHIKRYTTAAKKLARIPIIVSCFGVALLGSIASGTMNLSIIFALLAIILLVIHGNATNDIADYEIDRINLKNSHDRPLVSDDISFTQLWWLQGFAGISALGFSALLGPVALIATSIVALYNYLYSFKPLRVTDKTLLSPLTLAAAYTFQPFTLGYASSGSAEYPLLLALAIYFGFISRLLLKDYRDVKGDAAFGKQTFLLRYGSKVTCTISAVCALTSLTFALYSVAFSYGVSTVLIVGNVVVIYLLSQLSKTKTVKEQLVIIGFVAKTANTSLATLFIYFLINTYIPGLSLLLALLPLLIGGGVLGLLIKRVLDAKI
jgi:4-hydroxybenzoate polyprenyltransferase